jgi:hypothetical protein
MDAMSKNNQQIAGTPTPTHFQILPDLSAAQDFTPNLDDRDITILEWIAAESRPAHLPSRLH